MNDFETVRQLLHTNISWTFPQQDEAIAALDRIEAELELRKGNGLKYLGAIAEVERLRAALEKIASMGPDQKPEGYYTSADIARNALAEEKK